MDYTYLECSNSIVSLLPKEKFAGILCRYIWYTADGSAFCDVTHWKSPCHVNAVLRVSSSYFNLLHSSLLLYICPLKFPLVILPSKPLGFRVNDVSDPRKAYFFLFQSLDFSNTQSNSVCYFVHPQSYKPVGNKHLKHRF